MIVKKCATVIGKILRGGQFEFLSAFIWRHSCIVDRLLLVNVQRDEKTVMQGIDNYVLLVGSDFNGGSYKQ